MTSKELYQQELTKSDKDHHTPTAGAMVGHIISNLLVHSLKISQAKFFARDTSALFLDRYADNWITYEQKQFNELNQLLVNNNESIPTTLAQFNKNTMLVHNGATKYDDGQEQLFALVKDFDTQTLFITKAIKLAQKENWFELELALIKLLTWIKAQIATAQLFLGHNIKDGLYVEEDDDEF